MSTKHFAYAMSAAGRQDIKDLFILLGWGLAYLLAFLFSSLGIIVILGLVIYWWT